MFFQRLLLLASTTGALAATCQDNGAGTVPQNGAQSCVDSINSRGSEDCTVDGENTTFCKLSGATVYGSNTNSGSASAPCTDVAAAAQAIIDECGDGGQVAGYSSAGPLVISIDM